MLNNIILSLDMNQLDALFQILADKGVFGLPVFCFHFYWKQKMMMKMCIVGFLKIFSVKMKIDNNQKKKTIKFRFQLKTWTSFWVKWKWDDNECNFKQI